MSHAVGETAARRNASRSKIHVLSYVISHWSCWNLPTLLVVHCMFTCTPLNHDKLSWFGHLIIWSGSMKVHVGSFVGS